MATVTTRYGLRLPAGTDTVSVATDLVGPYTTIDAELGIPVTTALPSNPASGKTVAVSAAGPVYRSYFHNGTVPASAGWVELLNSSGTFGSDIKLGAAQKLVIGSDVNIFRSAADVLRTNDSFTVDLSLTVGLNLTVGGSANVTGDLSAGNLPLAWTAYTPTWGSNGTAPVLSNGAILGQWARVGKTIFYQIKITMGSTSTYGTGTYQFGLPFAASAVQDYIGSSFVGKASGGGAAFSTGISYILAGSSFANAYVGAAGATSVMSPTTPQTFASGDRVWLSGSYALP